MRLILDVTQEDIDDGEHGQSEWCALALALRRTLDEPHIAVGYGDVEVDGGVVGKLSKSAVRWQWRYDFGGNVTPRRFYVEMFE